MKTDVVGLSDRKKWLEAIGKLPEERFDIYFSPQYYELYKQNGDGEVRCFIFEDDDNLAIYPFLINKINVFEPIDTAEDYYDIQGAYGYNGVVATTCNDQFAGKFYKVFNEYCSDNHIIAEFTRFHPLQKNHLFSRKNMELLFDRQCVYLDLTCGYDKVWEKCYNSRNRNMIRKAKKAGCSSKISSKGPEYHHFHKLYTNTMERIMAEPYYMFPEFYFDNIVKLLNENQLLIDIIYQKRVVASVMVMFCGKYAHYHLSARDETFSIGANNYALDIGIQQAISKKCELFHFGGGHTCLPEDSLLRFKSCFSRDKNDFIIGKKIHNAEIYNKICLAWEKQFPEKKQKYAHILLKYRR